MVGEQGVLSRVSFKVSEDKENTYLSFSAQTCCTAHAVWDSSIGTV